MAKKKRKGKKRPVAKAKRAVAKRSVAKKKKARPSKKPSRAVAKRAKKKAKKAAPKRAPAAKTARETHGAGAATHRAAVEWVPQRGRLVTPEQRTQSVSSTPVSRADDSGLFRRYSHSE